MMVRRDPNIQHLFKFENFAACEDGAVIVLCWDCGMQDTNNTELISYHYQQATCARCNVRNAPNG